MGDFSAALFSTTPQMNLRLERPSESLKLFSHLRRLKKVFHSTSCRRMSAKIQIIMTRRQLWPALTTIKRIRLRSALQTRKKVDLPRQRETTEATLIRIRDQTDRGRTHFTSNLDLNFRRLPSLPDFFPHFVSSLNNTRFLRLFP